MLKEDEIIRGAVERYLYLACQAAIDIAEQVIALKKFPSPQSAAESFRVLGETGTISKKLADQLVGMVGFRNILAHGYESVDYEIVKKILVSGHKDLLELIQRTQGVIK